MTIYTDALAAALYVGDAPAQPLLLPLVDSDGGALAWVSTAAAQFVDPLGVSTPVNATVTNEGGQVTLEVTWPPSTAVTVEGLAWIYATVSAAAPGTATETVDPHPVIVEATGPWLTMARARKLWEEAPDDPWQLFLYLANARSACIEYAPEIAAGPVIPDYLLAQILQARNTWEADRSGGQEGLGSGEFVVTRHPLDWQVKELLRPTSTADRNVVT